MSLKPKSFTGSVSSHQSLHSFICYLQIGRPPYTQESRGPVTGRSDQEQFQSILLVDEVRDVDHGVYTCTAENLQGAKSASTTIKVVPKAKAKKP